MYGPTSAEYKAAKQAAILDLIGSENGGTRTCPICKSGSLSIDAEQNAWTCSGCFDDDAWHSGIRFLMLRDQIDSEEAVRRLAADQEETPGSLLGYVARGLPIFPIHSTTDSGSCSCGRSDCNSPGKHPRTPSGFKAATTDPEQIREWLKKWPICNWGMATGRASGIIVIDIDAKNSGFETWEGLRNEHPEPIETPTVRTGGEQRGEHLYFKHPERAEIRNSAGKLAPGIDVRGSGGYVLLPPSKTVHPYEWELSFKDAELAPLPDWLAEKLTSSNEKERTGERVGQLKIVNEGERHQTLVAVAGSLRQSGLGEEEIRAGLTALADSRFSDGGHRVAPREIEEVVKWVAEKPRSFHCTDLGNAERLIERHGEDLRYCFQWRSWLVWDGRRWNRDDTAQVKRWAHLTIRSIYTEASNETDEEQRKKIGKWAMASEARHRIDAMIGLSDAFVPVTPKELDTHPWLLNVGNGILDLKTGELAPHDRALMMTKLINIDFDAGAECPKWTEFLDLITGGDQGLQLFLQLAAGYSLTGSTDEDCFIFLSGTGKNGKTTFAEALRRILGDYAGLLDVETLLQSYSHGGEAPKPQLAGLFGKRYVIAGEMPENRKLNEALVKNLTGGDPIKARFLRQNPFEFEPTHKLWMYGNFEPKITGTDLAIWRRVRKVPFKVTIPAEIRRDRSKVLEEFAEEGSGILRWLVEGCLLWQANGLTLPESVAEATNEYRSEQDIFQQFLDERCEMHPDYSIDKNALFKAMKGWAEASNERDLARRSKKWLTYRMKERGIERGGDANKLYLGIRLSGGLFD